MLGGHIVCLLQLSVESAQFHGPELEPPHSSPHLHGSSHRWRRWKTPLLGLGFPVAISPQGGTWAGGRVCRDAEELIRCPVLQSPALPGGSSWCLGRRLRSQRLVIQDMQVMEEGGANGGCGMKFLTSPGFLHLLSPVVPPGSPVENEECYRWAQLSRGSPDGGRGGPGRAGRQVGGQAHGHSHRAGGALSWGGGWGVLGW